MITLTLSVATPSAALSTLASSRWRLKLNFGLEDGSWMPKTVDGWGESGARLLVTTDVAFEDGIVVRPRDASGRSVDGETLVGPPGDTRVLRVLQTSSVVTERGEEQVAFGDGGWCVQRPFGRPEDEEGRLGMYLDCTSGCSKRDVAIEAGTRVFFTGAVWDDAEGLRTLAAQRDDAAALVDRGGAQRPPGAASRRCRSSAAPSLRAAFQAEEMQLPNRAKVLTVLPERRRRRRGRPLRAARHHVAQGDERRRHYGDDELHSRHVFGRAARYSAHAT